MPSALSFSATFAFKMVFFLLFSLSRFLRRKIFMMTFQSLRREAIAWVFQAFPRWRRRRPLSPRWMSSPALGLNEFLSPPVFFGRMNAFPSLRDAFFFSRVAYLSPSKAFFFLNSRRSFFRAPAVRRISSFLFLAGLSFFLIIIGPPPPI